MNVRKPNSTGVVRIDHQRTLDFHAGRFRVDEKQRNTLCTGRCPGASRRDDQHSGDMAIEHERLGAIECESLGRGCRTQFDIRRPVPGGFIDCQRCNRLSACQARQPVLLLDGAGRPAQCARSVTGWSMKGEAGNYSIW